MLEEDEIQERELGGFRELERKRNSRWHELANEMKTGTGFPRLMLMTLSVLYTWPISMKPQIDKINKLMTTHGVCHLATESNLRFKVCEIKGKFYRRISTPVED